MNANAGEDGEQDEEASGGMRECAQCDDANPGKVKRQCPPVDSNEAHGELPVVVPRPNQVFLSSSHNSLMHEPPVAIRT